MALEIHRSKLMLGAGTALVAVSIGLVMQAFDDGPILDAQTSPTPPPALEVAEIELTSAAAAGFLPSTPDAEFVNDAREAAPIAAPALEDVPEITPAAALVDEPVAPAVQATPEPVCEITLASQVAPAAMVALDLSAPCLPLERFVTHHNGMMFSAVTDADGNAEMVVPALNDSAVFIVSFANGDGAVTQQAVEGTEQYGRVVVQWRGETGLGLHAREFEADYFTEGHIHASDAGAIEHAASGAGGVLQRFGAGAEPLMAEVYSFPVGMALSAGTVALSVEAEINNDNCGLAVEAQTLEMQAGEALRVQDLTLYMPDCDARGDFLVLKNLLEDMTLAAR
ncbi:hypothetical protein ACS3SW_13405 [Roseobacteraceae bacterium S113]